MNVETEIKLKINNPHELEEQLFNKSCRNQACLNTANKQLNIFFKSKDPFVLSHEEDVLRLRYEKNSPDSIWGKGHYNRLGHNSGYSVWGDGDKEKYFLTHKGKRLEDDRLNAREETEIEVDNPDNTTQILNILGYREFFQYEKYRIEYKEYELGSKIAIDKIPILGFFLEIEAQNAGAILKTMELLDIKEVENIATSYLNMLWAETEGKTDFVRFY